MEEKEKEREQFFKDIGYSEEDEFVEFPPEVLLVSLWVRKRFIVSLTVCGSPYCG